MLNTVWSNDRNNSYHYCHTLYLLLLQVLAIIYNSKLLAFKILNMKTDYVKITCIKTTLIKWYQNAKQSAKSAYVQSLNVPHPLLHWLRHHGYQSVFSMSHTASLLHQQFLHLKKFFTWKVALQRKRHCVVVDLLSEPKE